MSGDNSSLDLEIILCIQNIFLIWTNQRYAEQTEFAGYTAALQKCSGATKILPMFNASPCKKRMAPPTICPSSVNLYRCPCLAISV